MPNAQFPGYPPPRDRYDEMCAEDGVARPHWRALLDALAATSPAQWREREEHARQRIRENGVTYNVYADPKGADRPWALDTVPLVLPANEWAEISAAVAQRARLLDRVLADLYGPQQLLEDKAIPPALVFGHNGYLWPCRGIVPTDGRFLHVYAADLARSPDGQWWVIADRTQTPSGAGYALENRQIVSRLYPELYRDLHVQHLGNYFRALQQTLIGQAAQLAGSAARSQSQSQGGAQAQVQSGEVPTVVLLTPGPLNETYFEHVYLARQLGIPLVEGQDLTVRGDTLFLKTLGGLQRVHVVFRRLDDDFCDPLDLRTESTLGVPGLVDVARAGRVLVANALGSGVLESAGITGFLPALCERLLGEKLKMPAVATWWCGEAAAREYVEEHLEDLVLKPAYPSQRMEPVFGNRLDAEERAHWIARIRARPNAYVAQELVRLSQAPAIATDLTTGAQFNGDSPQLQPRTIGLRVYAVASGDGYQVMAGGLARVAGDTSIDVLSMQRGGSSKDTWVLAAALEKPAGVVASPATALHAGPPAPGNEISARDIVRQPSSLPSRAAENLFWLGRYAERVDCHARLLRVAMSQLLEDGAAAGGTGSSASALLMTLCVRAGLLPVGMAPVTDIRATAATIPAALRADRRLFAAIFDERWPGSLVNNILRAGRAGLHARERLSVDHWQAIERLQDVARRARQARQRPRLDLAMTQLDRVLHAGTMLIGYAMDDMVRDAGWRFLLIGRRIERIQCLATVVQDVLLSTNLDAAGIESLLDIADSADTWRQRYLRAPELLPVLDIVVFDADNPHALLFQAAKLRRFLDRVAVDESGAAAPADAAMVAALDAAIAALRNFDLARLEAGNAADRSFVRTDLALRIGDLYGATATISEQLGNRFFTHVVDATSQSLAV